MASPLTHAATGLALGFAFRKPGDGARAWILGAFAAAAPDLDAFGVLFGIPYESPAWGHRGFTHGLLFAVLLAALLAWRAFPPERRRRLFCYFLLAAASHGLLDAMTREGLGVAFFAPVWNERYFLPWRPLLVTPLHPPHLFGVHLYGARLLMVRLTELTTVWPCLGAFAALAAWLRGRKGRSAEPLGQEA